MISILIMVLAIVVLVLVQGFFSGSETVLTSASKTRLHQLAKKQDKGAICAEKMLEKTERFLGTTLLGTNVTITSASTICQLLVAQTLLANQQVVDFLTQIPIPVNWENVTNTLIIAPFILVFGEFIPKSIGRARADALAPRIAGTIRVASWIMFPFVWFVGMIAKFITHRLREDTGEALSQHVTREDLRAIADVASEQGTVPEESSNMLKSIFKLDERPVSAMMTPLVDVVSISTDATIASVEALAAESGHSQFPVHEGRIDEIVGVIDMRKILFEDLPPETRVGDLIDRDIYLTPESISVIDLLGILRDRKPALLVVVDEHGGITGILTMIDLLEEIVGSIEDEQDGNDKDITEVDENSFECEGRLDLRELGEQLGEEIENDGFETAAGMALKLIGQIPEVGTTVQYRDFDIKVLEIDRRRISRLRFTRRKT